MTASPAADQLPVAAFRGAGAKTLQRLERLGIRSALDLLLHLPIRYEDRTRAAPMNHLAPGSEALIVGGIVSVEVQPHGRRALLCQVSDGSGRIWLRFFHYPSSLLAQLVPGALLRCYGEVRTGPYGLEMVHPDYTVLPAHASPDLVPHLTAVYPTTEGIHQKTLRSLIQRALAQLDAKTSGLDELLPAEHAYPPGLSSLREALRLLHAPLPREQGAVAAARDRLAFEELVAHRLSLLRLRSETRSQRAPVLTLPEDSARAFSQRLPFTLTAAQLRVMAEIAADLAQPRPMLRLLQGDVGSGKTVIAAQAALAALSSGWQVAIMAPTEILAEQHQRNFSAWLEPMGIHSTLLLGRASRTVRQRRLRDIAEGDAGLVIGTHALFQKQVSFDHLGLVIIDEQHRFGVHQRLSLREKGVCDGIVPHQLILTATPIPRTLAMVGYADLDLSVIDELPSGREPVQTTATPAERRPELIGRIADWVARGRQAYWVCSLIEESEVLECQAAEQTAAQLAAALPTVRIALLHGRMKPAEKEAAMRAFQDHEIDLLVATTVIEVGIDVPNAGLMIIENAERFGLSQLHQLRGRVGRGPGEAYCVLLYHPPLGAIARERLAVLRKSNNGFEIAEKDWELRGSGEFLGTRQSGPAGFRIAQLPGNARLLPHVAETSETLLRNYPERIDPLVRRWVGGALRYAKV